MTAWFARPVLTITDMNRALDFELKQLGFAENWRFEADGRRLAEVERAGRQTILPAQWP